MTDVTQHSSMIRPDRMELLTTSERIPDRVRRLEKAISGGLAGSGDGGGEITGSESYALVYHNGADQSIPSAADTVVIYNTVHATRGPNPPLLNSSTGVVTIQEAGVYTFQMNGYWQDRSGGRRIVHMKVNGSVVARASWAPMDNNNTGEGLSATRHLAIGDQIAVTVYQDSGSATNWIGAPYLTVAKISPGGAKGDPGATGLQGPQGATGAQGPQGVKGDTGTTGSQGPIGNTGPPGTTGSQGPQGVKGDTGDTGAQGTPGTAGTPGEKWFSQAGAPAGGTGIVGDWSVDSTTGDFYEKTGASAWTLRGNLKGPQGTAGTPGSEWFFGAGLPAGGTGIIGDWYLDTSDGNVYQKTGSITWTLRGNMKGPTGATGSTGTQGPAGTPGDAWFTGAGAPAGGLAGSIVNDWYLNSANGDYYEKTGASTWTLRGNLKGATGNTGNTGAPGAPGAVWRSGAGAPAGALGIVGDWYINDSNGDVYEKTGASTYTLRDNLTGPQGTQGIQGIQGIQGVKGDTGDTGPAGTIADNSIGWVKLGTGVGGPAQYAFKWYRNAAHGGIGRGTGVSWDARSFDLTSPQQTPTSVWTCPAKGVWLFTWRLACATAVASAGWWFVARLCRVAGGIILANGSTDVAETATSYSFWNSVGSAHVELNASDGIYVDYNSASSVAMVPASGIDLSYLSAHFVGKT